MAEKTIDDFRKEMDPELIESIRNAVIAEVEAEYKKRFDEELDAKQKALEEANQKAIQAALEEWRKDQEPPKPEDLAKILNQEYQTFTVKLPWGEEEKEFTIQELPISVEKKVYKLLQEKLVPKLKDLNLLSMDSANLEEQAGALFAIIDPSLDLLSEAAVLVLNPRGKEPGLTKEWVQENLSSFRVWNILAAQIEVNKMRDFFSGAYRTSRGEKMSAVGTRR